MQKSQQRAFDALLSTEPSSNWREEVAQRRKDKAWLNMSADIALRVLEELDNKNMSQVTLAEQMGVSPQEVSKIVKGGENLTLETICKLEDALKIKLVTALSGDEIIVENNLESLMLTLAREIAVKVKVSRGVQRTREVVQEEKNTATKEFHLDSMNLLSFNNKTYAKAGPERDVLAGFKQTPPEAVEIKQGMTPQQIAEIVSDRVMEVVKEQFELTKEQFKANK
jgi:transcriptional regulator with XRE-family HTH domain